MATLSGTAAHALRNMVASKRRGDAIVTAVQTATPNTLTTGERNAIRIALVDVGHGNELITAIEAGSGAGSMSFLAKHAFRNAIGSKGQADEIIAAIN